MGKQLDPKAGNADSREWNMALWISKKDFNCIYENLIKVRKSGARLVEDSSKDAGLRLDPPAGEDKEARDKFRNFLRKEFEGSMKQLNQVLMGVRCMLDGQKYKVPLEDLDPNSSIYY